MLRRIIILTMVFVFAMSVQVFAEDVDPVAAIKKIAPNLKVDEANETIIKGLYEMVIFDGKKILYFHPETGAIIDGYIQKDNVNITSKREEELMKARVAKLPLDIAVKVGSGKHKVIEFTDPDCPYCRKAASYFNKRTDVTRYVFLFPLKRIHPKAEDKIKHILCSKDPTKTLEEVMAGKFDKTELKLCKDEKIDKRMKEMVKLGMDLGVRGTPFLVVNNTVIRGADISTIERLIGKGDK